jgi:hypothetical protein
MATPNKDNAVLFATYISLYVNDIACNAVRDIEKYVNRKDKKALKRWRELDKEVSHYFTHFRKTVKMEGLYFVSNFNEVLDECADKPITQLETAIKYCLRRHNLKDDGLAIKTLMAHVLTEFAVTTVQSFCEKLESEQIPFRGLKGWCISKIQMATREFYFRALREINNDILKEISDYSRVAVMLSPMSLSVDRFFDRSDPDKQFLLNVIESCENPEEVMANYRHGLELINGKKHYDEYAQSGFFTVVRSDDGKDTREEVCGIIAKHFGLLK